MLERGEMASLLPYLDPRRALFSLRIPLLSDDSSVLARTPYPFVVLNDSDPLSRVLLGEITTDAGSPCAPVFLLLQKDVYRLPEDVLRPVTNTEIDELWQRAFLHYRKSGRPSVVTVSGQLSADGSLSPFRSLFSCSEKQCFFEPPCPSCGRLLEVCRDDGLLGRAGLSPYSTSHDRYLHCPACAQPGRGEFYVFEHDRRNLKRAKDRHALIRDFALLCSAGTQAGTLPCADCPLQRECYGPQAAALSRIAPLAFYPFHLLICEAMSLNAIDFLALLSGAARDEVESALETRGEYGRARCVRVLRKAEETAPFFFAEGEERFLEVLYLKLSLIGELTRAVLGNGGSAGGVLGCSLDQAWVYLPLQRGLLPLYWNFHAASFDLSAWMYGDPTLLPKQGSLQRYSLGLTWYYALLANSGQDMRVIHRALGELLRRFQGDTRFSFEEEAAGLSTTVFSPANIFWKADGGTIGEKARLFWLRALELGWSLIRSGVEGNPAIAPRVFLESVEALRNDIKGALFSRQPAVAPGVAADLGTERRSMHVILKGIAERWRSALSREAEKLEETVVLSGAGAGEQAVAAGALEETVILSPVGAEQDAYVRAGTAASEESMAETVILSPEGPGREPGQVPYVSRQDEDVLSETVILGPSETVGGMPAGGDETMRIGGQKKKPGGDEILEETIILSPKPPRRSGKGA